MRISRNTALRAVITLVIAVVADTLCPPPLHAQTNWREVRGIRLGRFRAHIEASSNHTVRLIAQLDTSYLVSQELAPDSVHEWEENLFSQLDKPAKLKYILANAVLVEPYAADTATIGYALTIADTLGATRTVLTDKNGIIEFLDLLDKGALVARTLSDAELKRSGPVREKPIALARSVNYVYPRNAQLAGLSGSALVQFVVDTAGRAKPESITCIQATYKDFADAATAVVKTMEFTPAELEGHKIEQLVQYPIDFKLNAVLPVKPFEVPVRTGRGRR